MKETKERMSETKHDRKRRLARERKRRHRERILSQENEHEREIRKRNECIRKRLERLRESHAQVLDRRRTERERITKRRKINESDEAAQIRRQKNAECMRRSRARTRVREAYYSSANATTTTTTTTVPPSVVANPLSQQQQPIADAKFQNKTENHLFENREQKLMTRSVQSSESTHNQMPVQQPTLPTPRQAQQHTLLTPRQVQQPSLPNPRQAQQPTLPAPRQAQQHTQPSPRQTQQPSLPTPRQVQQLNLPALRKALKSTLPAPKKVQVLAPPVQVAVAKLKPVEKPRPHEKQLLAIANHQRDVMSGLVSLWKNGKLCDASIGNGSSTIKVHKLVLLAVCPKLLSVSNTHNFLQVNFPKEVNEEALNAFAEYMYNGILDLDPDILTQLKIIARKLDMKELEQLCNSHLSNHMHQPTSVTAGPFTKLPLVQPTMPIRAKNSSATSLGSTITSSMTSYLSVTTRGINNKLEIFETELPQVKKEAATMFSQDPEVTLLAPNKSGNAAGAVINPIIKTESVGPEDDRIKTEVVGPEDDRYGHWSNDTGNQGLPSTTSLSSSIGVPTTAYTSITSVPTSSTEFSFPSLRITDVKSTRLKTTEEEPFVSGFVGTVHSQSSSMNENLFRSLTQKSNSLPSSDIVMTSNSNKLVYPVELYSARGDNLPLLTEHTHLTP